LVPWSREWTHDLVVMSLNPSTGYYVDSYTHLFVVKLFGKAQTRDSPLQKRMYVWAVVASQFVEKSPPILVVRGLNPDIGKILFYERITVN